MKMDLLFFLLFQKISDFVDATEEERVVALKSNLLASLDYFCKSDEKIKLAM